MLGRYSFPVLSAAAFYVAASAVVWGQGPDSAIRGTVRDENEAVVSGVTVTARNRETGVSRAAVTDDSGQYRLPALMVGSYDLTAERNGFADARIEGVTLPIGYEVYRDFKLSLAPVEANITVLGAPPVIDLTTPEVSGVVSQTQIDGLPIRSRNYLALALLLPGTSQDASRSFFESVNVGASMTFNSTLNIVDGVTNNWAEDGEPRQDFPQDAVREFKVNQSQYGADYGQATGGAVQIVTKSGTNAFHGNLFEYYGGKALNTKGHFETSKPDYRRHQFGGSLGGPIVRDRTHFFVTFERNDLREFYTIKTGRSDLYSALEGTFARPSFTNQYFARVDHQFSDAQSVFVRYVHEDAKATCQGCGGTAVRSGWDQEVPRRSFVAGHTWVVGPNMLNELRFQYARGSYRLAPPGTKIWKDAGQYPPERLDRLQPAYNFPSLSYGSNADLQGPESRIEIRDSFGAQLPGGHELRFGGEFSHMPYLNDRAFLYAGTWTFAEDQYFDPNDPASIAALKNPILFASFRPPISVKRPSDYWAVFVRDTWRPRRNLTLTMGLRYEQLRGLMNEGLDVSSLPDGLPALYQQLGLDPARRGDYNNFGPRLGIAWDPRGEGATVIRAGYGLYYNHIRLLGNSFELLNLRQFGVFISNPSYPDPFQGRDPLEFASTAPPNITVIANDYAQPHAHQVNVGVSHTFARGFAIHLDGVKVINRNDRKIVNLNPPDPPTGERPLPEWGQIDENQSTSKLDYQALYARLEKRFSKGVQFYVSYTLTKSEDNNPLEAFVDTANQDADYGPSSAERRHALVASGVFELPFHLSLGAIWTLRSSLPFSALAGRDLNNDGAATDYVPGTTRNQGGRDLDLGKVNAWRAQAGLAPVTESSIDSTRVSSLDIRVSRAFTIREDQQLHAIVQVFNVANRTNLLAPYTAGRVTNALSENFGRIFTAAESLRTELGVRYVF